MGTMTYEYERPREKLRNHGVRYLTLGELIQVIIGSGTAQVSGAKLARQVQQLFAQRTPQYDELVGIVGLGDAKVCQLLAATEFGRRLATIEQKQKAVSATKMRRFVDDARQYHVGTVVCYWLDGAGQEIDRKTYEPSKTEHYTVTVKHLFADALVVAARSLVVVIVTKNAALVPNTREMGLVKAAQETAALLTIALAGFYAVHNTKTAQWGSTV